MTRRRRQLPSKTRGFSRLLSISSILSLVFWGSNAETILSFGEMVTYTHAGAGIRAYMLCPRALASRRRALLGAAKGGADVVFDFPLLALEACFDF